MSKPNETQPAGQAPQEKPRAKKKKPAQPSPDSQPPSGEQPVRFDVPVGKTPEETSAAVIDALEKILGRKLERRPDPPKEEPPAGG